ncbi:hypothetical protein JJC04_07740 [Flavobacterium covae]|nr:hypothetical protein [Flavobacterium covae]QYS92359.1 hypothetical protein JJC04_07740 [Flavobacterium covae]
MKNKIIIFLLLAIFQIGFSQNKTILEGTIVSDLGVLESILVVNQTTKKITQTMAGGQFRIEAMLGDILLFTSSNIEPLEIKLNKNSFIQTPLIIKVKVKSIEIKEVLVKTLSAKDLRIINSEVKSYTPAERKLLEAGTFKWYSPLLIPLGGMSITGLINKISGRTALLKKELKIEQNEINRKQLKSIFSKDFYEKVLKIPDDYLEGFLIYCSENPNVIEKIKAKNYGDLRFTLIDLTFKYKEIIAVQK